MSVHHDKVRKKYYVRWRDDAGVNHKVTFPGTAAGKREAQAYDYEIKRRKKAGDDLPTRGQEGIFFDELAQAWINEKAAQGRTIKWMQEWSCVLNTVIAPAFSAKPVDDISYEELINFFAQRYINRTQATRNRYLGYLRAMFRFGVASGLCKNNPLARWKKPKEAPRQTLLTVADLRKIMQHAAPHLRWALEVEFNLGVRAGASELFALTWDNVDWGQQAVRVYASKTKKWRIIPVSEPFLQKLKNKRDEAGTTFIVEYNGRPMKKFRKSLATACRRAGIGYKVVMTDIRHLFATTLLQGGADLAAVSGLMGHSSTQMTADQYYHLHAGEKRRAVNLLPSLDGEHSGEQNEEQNAEKRSLANANKP
ncbi:tyrosine-type recombinase/integrase [Desulfarculus baarsii]